MILQPAVIALLLASGLTVFLVLAASLQAVGIIRKWDLKSGDAGQLTLERRTNLISILLAYAFAFQLFSLFLFVHTADDLSSLFTGAMCAAGTLQANRYGYPVLILKLLNAILGGLWLILNRADNGGADYPLIKHKYYFLLGLTPLIVAEAFLQIRFFLGLNPDIVTTCCSALFNAKGTSSVSIVISVPTPVMKTLFACCMVSVLVSGSYFYLMGRGSLLQALFSVAALLTSLASVFSFIGPYIYELPTHHCPFCLLRREYDYIGYPMYIALLLGAVSGMGTGLLAPFRFVPSLAASIPRLQKKLSAVSVVSFVVFAALVLYRIWVSHLIM
jgi:hypothetical protein